MSKKDTILDVAEIAGKTAISLIPVGGALATAIYDTVKGNALAKRQDQWKRTLEDRISKIEETLESIGNNELFTTALVKATELAMRTSREEKMSYLANAVISSLAPNIDEEKLIIFLDLLDKYTISHIKIIKFFNNPTYFTEVSNSPYMMGSPATVLFQAYPELDNVLFKKVYKDLYIDGMVNTENLNINVTGSAMVAKRTTELGDDFLRFISSNTTE